jgi:hypothetical protein
MDVPALKHKVQVGILIIAKQKKNQYKERYFHPLPLAGKYSKLVEIQVHLGMRKSTSSIHSLRK